MAGILGAGDWSQERSVTLTWERDLFNADPGVDPCDVKNPDWPTDAQVNEAVEMSSYDSGTYDKFTPSGFRNYMEGFDVLPDNQVGRNRCYTNRMCACETGAPKCEGPQSTTPIARLLHNSVGLCESSKLMNRSI